MLPDGMKLFQNYPNPFNPTTKIGFSVPFKTKVRIDVYDIVGRRVAELLDEEKPAGKYEVDFVARNLSSGIYIYQLSYSDRTLCRKMLLIK